MKIKHFSIENVKSFKECVSIDFDRSLNILIGPNGGGKSNLLSILTIVLNHYFYKQFEPKFETDQERNTIEKIEYRESFGNVNLLLEKYVGHNVNSTIRVKFETDESDYINMKLLSEHKNQIEERLKKYKCTFSYQYPDDWHTKFKNNQVLEYSIINNNIVSPEPGSLEALYLSYLINYHSLRWITNDFEKFELYSPAIFFPPSRGLGGNFTVEHQSLKSIDLFNRLRSVSSLQSRAGTVSLADIAVIHFSRKHLKYTHKAARSGDATTVDDLFNDDEEVKLLSKYLEKIGYGWRLEEEEEFFRYKFILTKGSKDFDINKASSGELEILNFLLGIFSLNVQGGVVFIDEPEIHLHPKWQRLLLEIFSDLTEKRNNQFILSTHSPTFVNDLTYTNIIRIYKDVNDVSKLVFLKDAPPFEMKDVLPLKGSE